VFDDYAWVNGTSNAVAAFSGNGLVSAQDSSMMRGL